LDYSYQQQLELLTQVERGVADVVASRHCLESRTSTLRQGQAEITRHAGLAPGTDGERQALRRKTNIDRELSDLAARYEALRADEKQFTAARERLMSKIDAFKVHKEIIKANYAAAEAQSGVGEVWSSISREMDHAGISAIAYERRRELLMQLLASIKGMAAARQRLDLQTKILRQNQAELEDQARQAIEGGQEELAQQAFAQKNEIDSQLPDLTAKLQSLRADEEKFMTAYEQLAAKVEILELRTGATEASHTAADSHTRIAEATSGISKNTGAGHTEAPHDPTEVED
jgi:phage shock protein A